MQDDEALTIERVMRQLGCCERTVRSLISGGSLRAHRIGAGPSPRGVRIHQSSIDAYKMRFAIEAHAPRQTTGAGHAARSSTPQVARHVALDNDAEKA